MIEAVLFDVGDTLLLARTSNPTAVLEIAIRPIYDRLRELRHDLPSFNAYLRVMRRQFLCAYIWSRIIRREFLLIPNVQRVHTRFGISLDLKQARDVCRGSIPVVAETFTVNEDALDVVSRLHDSGFKLGLVSNTILPGFAIDEFLGREGFLEYFPVRIYSSEVRYMKPDRRIFQFALDRLGVPAERTLFVGDRADNDVKGANRAGMRSVLFVRGDRIPRGAARADHTIRRLAEIPGLLETTES